MSLSPMNQCCRDNEYSNGRCANLARLSRQSDQLTALARRERKRKESKERAVERVRREYTYIRARENEKVLL